MVQKKKKNQHPESHQRETIAYIIGGLAVVAFWRSPHGPLGSRPSRAGYSQRRKRKEKREKGKKKKERKKEKEKAKREEKKGKKTRDRYGPVIPCLGFVRHCIQGP